MFGQVDFHMAVYFLCMQIANMHSGTQNTMTKHGNVKFYELRTKDEGKKQLKIFFCMQKHVLWMRSPHLKVPFIQYSFKPNLAIKLLY